MYMPVARGQQLAISRCADGLSILAGGRGQDKLPFDSLLQTRTGPATQ
jgi:hypothetical protein